MLEILGVNVIDVARLKEEPALWSRFIRAADVGSKELEQLDGRPVRFVHPWPGEPGAAPPFLDALAGGNDFDLDVLLTLIPGDEKPAVLIGDLNVGIETIAAATIQEWDAFSRRFHISRQAGRTVQEQLVAYHETPRGRGLIAFLRLVAEHFEKQGFRVLRMPLVLVPTRLISSEVMRAGDRPPECFTLGFCNAVIETNAAGEMNAEAFSSGLPVLDRKATEIFANGGCRLTLYPTLVSSIIFEGGYRCATQELRESQPGRGN
jgi:hypothetical protein